MATCAQTSIALTSVFVFAGSAIAAPAAFTKIPSSQSGLAAVFEAPPVANGPRDMTGGASIGDFDGNGFNDVFVVSDGVANTDRLFLNNGDGTFTEATNAWNLRDIHVGVNAAVADYDNDGDLDVYVTSFGPAAAMGAGHHRLYTNTGTHFVDQSAAAGVQFTSANHADGWGAAFSDIDLDGDLDLFVAGRMVDLYTDGDTMFRNNGDGTFSDATQELFGDFFTLNRTYSFSPRFADMNGDRRPELLLTSDYQFSRYFEQLPDGTFVNIAPGNGTAADSNGMGNTVADFDGDGLLDWYVTSIYWDDEDRNGPEHNGNMLYINANNQHTFTQESDNRNCQNGHWGWGVVAHDFNHDGLMDIAETNGWRNSPEHVGEMTQLLLCQPDNTFIDAAATAGFDHTGDGRALITFDYDNDNDMDILVVGLGEELHLYRNDVSGPDAASLRMLFDTTPVDELAPNGVGVSITAHADGVSYVSQLDGGSSYIGQSELSIHLGLGAATSVEAIFVTWSNGDVTPLADVAVNQTINVVAGGGAADFNGDGASDASDLATLLSRWGTPHLAIDLDGSGAVDSSDLAILLSAWSSP